MKVLSRRVVIPHGPMRAPVIGFVTYIHPTQPRLLRRHGWEVADDIHDDQYDLTSSDNGRTWSDPVPTVKNYPVPGGAIVHTENGALYVPERDRLIVLTNMVFQPDPTQGNQMGHPYRLRISVSRPDDYLRATPLISDFGVPGGVAVSFVHPLLDSRGRALVPVMWQGPDPDGALARLGVRVNPATGLTYDYGLSGLLIGEFRGDDLVDWTLSAPVPIQPGLSSRGLYEPALAELRDGRLAMVLRGSNHLWLDKPGYKWLAFSSDGGRSWSLAQPLPCDDGSRLESSATGSALLRCQRSGALYWIGNLCIDGVRPYGNMPRSPLVIARVREEPFALVRDSITVIDRAAPGEHPETQHSNFKCYQDRASGDLVLYLTRYSERGFENNSWLLADHYEYRVALG